MLKVQLLRRSTMILRSPAVEKEYYDVEKSSC